MDIERLGYYQNLSGGPMTTATDHTTTHHTGPRSAEAPRRSVEDVERRDRVRELENELERYRKASEDTLQQLDWCIGYLSGTGRWAVARSLSKNRSYIRTHLLKRAREPLPTEQAGPTQKRNAVVRSTKRNSKKDVERPSHDRSEETVESPMDDDEVVVDGFKRVAVAGLEVMTFDGVLRARTLGNLEEERQRDHPRG
jgi:hypothetical protein